jgi:hypothetical protein
MQTERELGWDEPIENDGPDFEVLPEGDCDFEVIAFERGRHPGSEKLPPCNKAVLEVRLTSPAGQTTVKHNLFLHTKTEGLLCAFFTAIGQRKHGQKVNMNWNMVVGAKGRCKIGIRKWKNDNGEEKSSNYIKKFYEPKADTGQAGFTPGQF